jgi:ATP-dependent RNA helicase HelY
MIAIESARRSNEYNRKVKGRNLMNDMSDDRSPAERFAAAKSANKYKRTREFCDTFDFPLDPFQIEGCHSLEDGHGVLVAAPTGAGKTIVGEFAAFLAIATGKKCFYTAPIKALSNQKFSDFKEMFGEEKVGLLTGDTSVNSEAQIVVMTTEVLRNMIYAESHTLRNLQYVVMDEVHYLADKFRGAVWEEILIHLPESIQVASLSATVSNAEEFGDWLGAVRGNTDVIVSETRPVPLYQHVLFGHQLLDLFVDEGKVNPEIVRLEKDSLRKVRGSYDSKKGRGGNWQDKSQLTPTSRALNRAEVIERLDREGLLPAITFIFSRNACSAAVHQCVKAGIRLTNARERSEIREVVFRATANIPEEDLVVLGFSEWLDGLERGIAAHHAGLLPSFKETVEELFQRGLVKCVFATETLAMGINMPARTVVLEKLMKWNGESHVSISPGEFTQLTGRAGRRGIDIEGNAVILWSKEVDSGSVAGLASTRAYPLKSSFKPTYNMTINLISRFGAERARTSLESSFAQYQADKAVVGLARQIKRNQSASAELMGEMACHQGDFVEYAAIRSEIKAIEKALAKMTKAKRVIAEDELVAARRALRAHPCHGCSEREEHSRIAERLDRLARETRGLEDRVSSRTDLIAKRFDLVQVMLEKYGYLKNGVITQWGTLLANIYGETDLLIAQMIKAGSFDTLDGPEMVSVLSALVFEARRDESPKIPRGEVEEVLNDLVTCWADIQRSEVDIGLEPMREPDLAFCWASYRWASGHSLAAILRGTELTVGDFVRAMKQIIDLLRQIGNASPHLSQTVDNALKRIDRGIVSYAGIVA